MVRASDARQPDAPRPGRPLCVRGRVLIAEESAAARAGLSRIFAAEGFSVVECGNGSDIIPLAKQHRPDVVFVDAAMRRVNAGECVRVLERFADTRSVVVVITCPREFETTRL